jgi:hypothetical protein
MPQNSGKPQRKPTISHQLAGFYNRDGVCLPRGTYWIFKYSSGTELQASSAASPTANSCQKSRSTAEVGLSSRCDADWLALGFWSNSWMTAHTDHRTHKNAIKGVSSCLTLWKQTVQKTLQAAKESRRKRYYSWTTRGNTAPMNSNTRRDASRGFCET